MLLDATIAEDGTVRSTSIVSGPALLAQAATAAVRDWRTGPLPSSAESRPKP